MQTQTPAEAKRFLVRFISGFGAGLCLLVAGLVYLQYAIGSFYFPSGSDGWSLATLAALLLTAVYCSGSFVVGRFLFFGKPEKTA